MAEITMLRQRLLGHRPPNLLRDWIAAIAITLWAGIIRIVGLAHPNTLVFDETYYVKQGWSMILYGHERRVENSLASANASPKVDEVFAAGTPDVFGPVADFVVHPPVGKWLIGFGQWAFGVENPFSWRIASAVFGTLSILMIIRIGRRLFGSTSLGLIAGVLMAFDGQHFVHSRTGLLDVFVMFFALAAFGALLIDRDRSRERLAEIVGTWRAEGMRADDPRLRFGPWLGLRPWRLVAGVSLGLATGVKWSGLYFLVAFGLLTVFWDMGARRAAGIRRWWFAAMLIEAPQAAVTMVGATVLTYVATWTGWFLTDSGFDRHWADENPAAKTFSFVPDALRSLWHYHVQMYEFHRGLHTKHDYMSNPWSWIVQGRPTSFYYQSYHNGQSGCTTDNCSAAITNLGNPVIWWAGALSIAVLFTMWAWRRDWRAGAILAGYAGGYLPWFTLQDRTIYTFYSVAFLPFVVLGVVYCLGLAIGPATASPGRRRSGLIAVSMYVVLAAAVFVFFYPVLAAEVIPYESWRARMWFPSWI
ncbi:dolichyl-phosphate-mannose--protein mannosyltransferase [Dermatophilus congolensis]|nr:phospholipid carrier-dependent glycosyltransferase [Dermatophilus congolensis]